MLSMGSCRPMFRSVFGHMRHLETKIGSANNVNSMHITAGHKFYKPHILNLIYFLLLKYNGSTFSL